MRTHTSANVRTGLTTLGMTSISTVELRALIKGALHACVCVCVCVCVCIIVCVREGKGKREREKKERESVA